MAKIECELTPWAREALRPEIAHALELASRELAVNLSASGRSERGPWVVRVNANGRILEHRGWDLESIAFEALELFSRGVATTATIWRAGSDGLAHGHAAKRTTWTLCGQPAVGEQFAHGEHARCSACLRTLVAQVAA